MKFLLFLLSALTASAQVNVSIAPGISFSQRLFPHNHPYSPLLFETFEGTGYLLAGWGENVSGGGSINEDYTSVVLHGEQSLLIDGGTDDPSYSTNSFSAQGTVFAHYRFRITSAPGDEDAFLSLFRFRDVDGATVMKMQVDSTMFPRITTGGQTASALSPITANVTYYVWLSWRKNDSGNSKSTLALSTGPIQPTSGDWYVSVSNGTTVANDASQVFLGYANDTVDDAGPEMSTVYDYVLIDDAAVPDYP